MANYVVTQGYIDFLNQKVINSDIQIDTLWGEYGDYEIGEGPVFTPTTLDTIDDLLPDKDRFPIESICLTNNIPTVVALISGGTDRVYVGAALAANNGQLVVARVAFAGIKKEENVSIGTVWNLNVSLT